MLSGHTNRIGDAGAGRLCQPHAVLEFVNSEKRTHAFAVFYIGGSVAGATGPLLFGLMGNVIGLTTALAVVACVALTTVPMVWTLRPAFRNG